MLLFPMVVVVDSGVASATEVSSVTASALPATAGVSATYTVGFTATTGLSAGSGTITLDTTGSSESGTVLPSVAADYTVDDVTSSTSAAVSATPDVTGSGATVTIVTPVTVSAGDQVTVTVTGVTNAPVASPGQAIAVSTSADTTAVRSATFDLSGSADGSGTLTVSPAVVDQESPAPVTFMYTAATGGMNDGTVTVGIPTGWTAPSTSSSSAGYVTASTGTVSVDGQSVIVTGVTLPAAATMTVTYGTGTGTGLSITTGGEVTISADEESESAGTLTGLASPPTVEVVPSIGDSTIDADPAQVSTFAGGGSGDGTGTAAGFTSLGGDVVVGSTLVVADDDQLRTVDLTTGAVSTLVGTAGDTACATSTTPADVDLGAIGAVASDGTWVYEFTTCSGASTPEVLRTSLSTGATTLVANVDCAAYEYLSPGVPVGLAYASDGNLYALCNGYSTLAKINPATGATSNIETVDDEGGLTADSSGLWVTSLHSGGNNVFQVTLGSSPTESSGFSVPSGVTVDGPVVSAGSYLYLAVSSASGGPELYRVTKSDGTMTLVAGNGSAGLGDGDGPNAWFDSITGLASDGTNLWVADGGTAQLVRKVVPGASLSGPVDDPVTIDDTTIDADPAQVSTFAGGGSGDGTGTAAGFSSVGPEVTIGTTLVVADDDQLRTVNLSTGVVSTLVGTAGDTSCAPNSDPADVDLGAIGALASDGTWIYEFTLCSGSNATEVLRTSLSTGATSLVSNVNCAAVEYVSPGAPDGLAYGPDGNLYAGCNGFGTLVRVNPTTGASQQIGSYYDVGGVTADSSGLWVTGTYAGTNGVYQVTDLTTDPTDGTPITPPSGDTVTGPVVSAGSYLYLAVSSVSDGPELYQVTKSDGSMRLVAGNGSAGLGDGDGPSAWFDSIAGLTSDGTNLWVADGGSSQLIRKAVPGDALPGPTDNPITIDDSTISADPAQVTTFAGGGSGDGTGTSAGFTSVSSEVTIGDTLVVADDNQLRTVNLSSGGVSTLVGTAGDISCQTSSTPADVKLGNIAGIASDGTWLYEFSSCGSSGYPELFRTSLSTGATTLVANVGCTQGYPFSTSGSPVGLAYGPDGNLYAACNDLGPVVRVNPTTGAQTDIGTYDYTSGITADSSGLWIISSGYYDQTYAYQITLSGSDETEGTQFDPPSNVFFDGPVVSAGPYLYASVMVAGGGQELYQITKSDGDMTLVAGTGSAGVHDGDGPNAWLDSIAGLTSDGTNLWLADSGSAQLIRKVTPGDALPGPTGDPLTVDASTINAAPAYISTFAGGGSGDGTGTGAGFSSLGAEVTIGTTLYVAADDQIRSVDLTTGAVSTLVGGAGDSSCDLSPTVGDVRLGQVGALATDGTWLYEFSLCGGQTSVLRTSLTTGATSLVSNVNCAAIEYVSPGAPDGLAYGPDGNLYAGCNGYGTLVRVNPTTGAYQQIGSYTNVGGITADSSGLWVTCTYAGENGVYQVTDLTTDPTDGTLISPPTGANVLGPVVSAGSYLYATAQQLVHYPDGEEQEVPEILQINKSTDAMLVVAGGGLIGNIDGEGAGAEFTSIAGLASDGTNLWITAPGSPQLVDEVRQGETVADVTSEGGPKLRSEEGGGDNPSEKQKCQPCSGDPVDNATGEFDTVATDMSVPGRGPSLDLERTYGSESSEVLGPFGYGWSFSYGMSLAADPYLGSSVMDVTQENGSIVQFAEQTDGSWLPASRVQATLVHNSDGSWTFTRDATELFTFGSAGQLTSESDLNGDTTTLTYNDTGQLSTVTDPEGRELSFAYGSNGLVSSVTDPAGTSVDYGYDSDDQLTSVTDVRGGVTDYAYDSKHLLTSITDPDGGVTANTYDSSRRVIAQTDPAGRTTTWSYDLDPLTLTGTTTVTDPAGRVTVDTFSNGELTSSVAAYGTSLAATTTYTYDPSTDEVATVTGPDGHVTSYTYDTNGNMLTETDGLDHTTTWTYNAYNEVTSETPPATYGSYGTVTTTYSYDQSGYSSGGAGNLTSVSTPIVLPSGTLEGSRVVHYVHGDSTYPGDVTSIVDPDGNTTSFSYDAYGDKVSETDPANTDTSGVSGSYSPVTDWVYDTNTGWVTEQLSPRFTKAHPTATSCSTPAAGCTTYTYNNEGQVLSTTDGNGDVTTNVFDGDGNLTSTTDGDGKETTYAYNGDGQVTSTTTAAGTGKAQTSTTGYDSDGEITSQTNAADDTTSYGYNALGDQVSVTDPDDNTTTYAYDLDGNLVAKGNPGVSDCTAASTTDGCTVYSYNADNEQTGIAYHDSSTPDVSDVSYDGDGNKTAETDGTGTSTWSYDSVGDLISTTDGSGATTSYGYDDAGNQTSITYPGSTGTVTQNFDADGRESSVTDWSGKTTTFTYDPDGDLTSNTDPTVTTGGSAGTPVVDTTSYDDADDVSGIATTQGSTSLQSFDYTRDGDGQVTGTVGTGALPEDTADTYTALNQLATQTVNASSGTNEPATVGYGYDTANDPTGLASGATESFDPAGELCWAATAVTVSSSCTSPPAGARTYTYNDLGERTSQNVGDGTGTDLSLGYNQAGELTSVSRTATLVTAQAELEDSMVLNADGTVDDWGRDDGLLGDGENGDNDGFVTTPQVVDGISNVVALSGSGDQPANSMAESGTLALTASGNVWAWGESEYGSLGATQPTVPTEIDFSDGTPLSGATAVYTDSLTSLAVVGKSGMVYAWGDNAHGDLGNGTTDYSEHSYPAPVETSSGTPFTGAASVLSNDGSEALALKTDGTVWQWGISGSYPTQVSSLSDIVQVASAGFTFYALNSSGNVYKWTINAATGASSTPTEVGSLSGIKEITSSWYSVYVLTDTGHVYAWGEGDYGELGNGTTTNSTTPVEVSDISNVTNIAAGFYYAMASESNGSVWAWGANYYAQLGNGTYTQSDVPVEVTGYDGVSNGTIATYTYNGDGLRTTKTLGGITQHFVYNTTAATPELLTDGTTSYLYGPDGTPLEQTNSTNGTLWYHHDQQGSTRLLTEDTGIIVGTATYNAYGQTTNTTGITTPLGYDGAYTDTETGYLYLQNRYYDPVTAQFITVDPLVAGTGSAYDYVGDNPLNGTDPSGLSTCGHPKGLFDVVGSLVDCASSGDLSGAAETVASAGIHGAGGAISASPAGTILKVASQATGHTLGGCISGSLALVVSATGSICYEQTPSGQNGITLTAGSGKALGYGGDITGGPSVSNAQTLSDLGGWFGYVSGSAGADDVASGSVSVGLNACNRGIYEGYLGVGPDGGLNIDSIGGIPLPAVPVSGGVGASYTWTYESWG